MNNELEKQFFDTFGVEPKHTDFAIKRNEKGEMEYLPIYTYPQITNSIYLMLLATLTCISSIEFPFSDIQKLKEDILKEVIKHSHGFDKHQIQAIFEEG